MSSFIFGDFFSEKTDILLRKKIEDVLVKDRVNIYFDEQMNDIYCEISHMLNEHPSSNSNVSFCLTSVSEMYNCEDLLYPDGLYTEEELFPDGEEGSRERYEELSLENLNSLKNAITKILDILETKFLRVFITNGYDTEFNICCCTIEEMITDIYKQVTEHIALDSKIYLLKN